MHYLLLSLFLLFSGCCGFKKEVSRDNLEGEYITNKANERIFIPSSSATLPPRKYPWQKDKEITQNK